MEFPSKLNSNASATNDPRLGKTSAAKRTYFDFESDESNQSENQPVYPMHGDNIKEEFPVTNIETAIPGEIEIAIENKANYFFLAWLSLKVVLLKS